MPRRPARFTQADIERVIRAARKQGATAASVKMADGTEIKIELSPESTRPNGPGKLERKRAIVL
jgi:acetolactate synthase regulatory subunit